MPGPAGRHPSGSLHPGYDESNGGGDDSNDAQGDVDTHEPLGPGLRAAPG